MSQHSWTYDAPTGVYKNHDMSEKLRYAAIAETKFLQFTAPEPGYGKKKGESVTITRVSALSVPTSGKLTEGVRIPEDAMTLATVAITVSEFGRAVPYTSLSEDLSVFNVENSIQKVLRDQMKLVVDNAAAAAFKTGQIKAVGNGVASISITTNGTASGSATANMNLYHVEQVRDYMFNDLLVPAYEGDDYICLCTTKVKRGVMSDPAFETWNRYTDPSKKYNSEIGRMENIRFIEINNPNALDNTIGTASVTGEAVFFGADAVAMAVVEDPELRAGLPQDFGRSKSVAWYGIMEWGHVWTTANAGEAKVVHWTST